MENVFLLELRPLLFVLRLFGISPLQPHGNEIQLRFLSFDTIYFTTVNILQLIPTIWMFYRGILVANEQDVSLIGMTYGYNIGSSLPNVIPLLLFVQFRQQEKFISAWNQLQKTIYKFSVSAVPLQLGLRRKIYVLLILISVSCTFALTWRVFILGGMPTLVDFLHALGLLNVTLPQIIWYASCKSLQALSAHIVLELQALQEYNESGKLTKQVNQIALQTRCAWLQLARLVVQVGNTASVFNGVLLLNNFIFLLFMLYQVILLSVDLLENLPVILFLGSLCINAVFIITLICSTAHSVHEKMVTFLVHMHHIFPQVSFNGYAIVGRGLLSTVYTAAVSNIIVLVQLNINQKRINIEEFLTLGDSFNNFK